MFQRLIVSVFQSDFYRFVYIIKRVLFWNYGSMFSMYKIISL